jgi:hypothetical protein
VALDNRDTNLAIRPIDSNEYFRGDFSYAAEDQTARAEPGAPPTPMRFWEVVRLLRKKKYVYEAKANRELQKRLCWEGIKF